MKIQPGRNPYGFVLVQSAQHLQKNVIPSLWQCSTVTLQKWWMSILGNAMARNMKTRPGRNPYELRLVQSAQNLQKNDSYAFNSERKKISTSSQWPLAYVLLLLAVFWVSFGQFSQCKIDFSIFFQPQGGRHISLFSWGTKLKRDWERSSGTSTEDILCSEWILPALKTPSKPTKFRKLNWTSKLGLNYHNEAFSQAWWMSVWLQDSIPFFTA